VVELKDLIGKELFRRVLKVLAGKVSKEVGEAILELSVEAIREYIHYGKGAVKEP